MPRMSVAPSPTLASLGSRRLRTICRALGYTADQARFAVSLFQELAESWGSRPTHLPAPWPSDITDDHTPYEFSLAVDGEEPELRFLIEVLGEPPSIASNWAAALAMNEKLAAKHGAHLGRFEMVKDLFAPTDECPRFSLWHAVCLKPGAEPDIKIYLNPQAQGVGRSRAVVEEAMTRLGFGAACANLPATGPEDELCYFSLDLSARRGARIKIYTAHHHATVSRLEAAVSKARSHVPGKVLEFCSALGESLGPYDMRPVLTCLSFADGNATPTTGTIHFPVRSYATTDGVAAERVLRYLPPEGAAIYRRALEAFSDRRLEDGIGMQTYASLRVEPERRRVTVYLAPEVYDVGQVAMTLPTMSGVIARPNATRSWRPAAGGQNG